MPVIKSKPTSPGSRFVIKVKTEGLFKGRPIQRLLVKKSKRGGRNNQGRITTRHRGGGHKQSYRLIDFKRNKNDVLGIVERIEYDPNRTANIALILYRDGERRYIVAPKGLQAGEEIISADSAPVKIGNCMPIRNIPIGTEIHCIELKPGKGAQIARSAGAMAQLLAKESSYATLRLRSGETRKVHSDCRAVIGEVGKFRAQSYFIG